MEILKTILNLRKWFQIVPYTLKLPIDELEDRSKCNEADKTQSRKTWNLGKHGIFCRTFHRIWKYGISFTTYKKVPWNVTRKIRCFPDCVILGEGTLQ